MAKTQESEQAVRIGTLVNKTDPAPYIRQILHHGFESFQLTFWITLGQMDIRKTADEVAQALDGSNATISSVTIFGNPLESQEADLQTLRAWEALIDNAHLFGTDLVTGFAGRVRGKRIDESIGRFAEVFGPLTERAGEKGVRIAFENCDMGGTWDAGDWNIAHNPAAWELMFAAVPAKNIGLEWEPCHQLVNLIDPLPQMNDWVDRIFHVHGKDATVRWDIVRKYGIHGPRQFAFHRTPGFGDSNWTNIISDLRQGGFRGSIDIEGWHDPVYRDELEMTGQVHALNYLKRCRGGEMVPNPE